MAKRRPANKGKKCVRYKRTSAGKRCAAFGSKRGGSKKRSKARKGRCTKWSKGRTRCMKRAA